MPERKKFSKPLLEKKIEKAKRDDMLTRLYKKEPTRLRYQRPPKNLTPEQIYEREMQLKRQERTNPVYVAVPVELKMASKHQKYRVGTRPFIKQKMRPAIVQQSEHVVKQPENKEEEQRFYLCKDY